MVGKPDPMRTEIVTAFVILAPGHQASDELARDLQEHVRRVTAPYKYPREIHFVSELPKTVSGKIRRTELRDGANADVAVWHGREALRTSDLRTSDLRGRGRLRRFH
ncbi:MAG: AMP-binding enzyme, partial [Candidatus Dormibacteria bacterium]